MTREGAHAVLANLKAQNSALHVTTERLVDTNSEIMARLNKQSDHVIALQEALADAQASQPPQDMQQQTPGMLIARLRALYTSTCRRRTCMAVPLPSGPGALRSDKVEVVQN